MKDKLGNILKPGDIVHNDWGYDLIVDYDGTTSLGWYGHLVCEKGHSCENIPYALCSEEVVKISKPGELDEQSGKSITII